MTALRVHSKTWGTQCQTKASVIFSNAKTFPNPRSARPRRHGQNSFKATAQCWLPLTSSARSLTLKGLITDYILFFIYIDIRRVIIAGLEIAGTQSQPQRLPRAVGALG